MKKSIALIVTLLAAGFLFGQAQLSFDTSIAVQKSPSLYGLVVSVRDSIRYKKSFNGKMETDLLNDQSLTKSIGALLVGIAIDKGFIPSVDTKIAVWFPELKKDSDSRKGEITLRQLMNQASGLSHEDLESFTGVSDYLSLPDPSGYILKAPMLTDPGKVFHYNNAASHLLSVIVTRSTGMNTLAFAEKYLFGPLGIHDVSWAKMNDGYYDGCGLLSVRLRTGDLVKIGSLLLHDGKYGGQTIVSKKWIGEILRPSVSYNTEWGFENSRYALCWYHAIYKGTEFVYCLGWGGQFLIVIPELKTVIAVNQNHEEMPPPKQAYIFTRKIFPLIYSEIR